MSVSCKRKFEAVESEEEQLATSPTEQRKSILDISMSKLRITPCRKVEPSLRRSVLIFNTLKNIENQLKLEGICVPKTSTTETVSDLVPALQVPSSSEDILDALPNAQQNTQYSTNSANCEAMDFQQVNHAVAGTSTPSLLSPMALPAQPTDSSATCYHDTHNITDHHYTQNTTHIINDVEDSRGGGQVFGVKAECLPIEPGVYTTTRQPPCLGSQESWCSELTPPVPQSNVSTYTESVLSDTSKFILDSILSSDKLVTVASFTSLFELDNNELMTDCSNQNNNSSNRSLPASISASTSQQGAIPPISCLCSSSSKKDLTISRSHSVPYFAPSWSHTTPPPQSAVAEHSWHHGSNTTTSCPSSTQNASTMPTNLNQNVYQHCSGTMSCTDTSNNSSSSALSPPASSIPSLCSPTMSQSSQYELCDDASNNTHWTGSSSGGGVFTGGCSAIQGHMATSTSPSKVLSQPATSCRHESYHSTSQQSATSCRQESSLIESQSIFGDVDCSSFDFDFFLPSLSSPSMKLTQLNHDDLMHSLPSPDVGFGPNCAATPALLNPKTDTHGDELDRIMQIVVGI